MAWTDPPTFNAGDVLTASQLNQYLRDNQTYLKGIADGVTASGAKVDRNGAADLSIADTTDTDVTLTNEVLDLGGWWSSGASFTTPAGAIPAGYTSILLDVLAYVRFTANGTGARALKVLKNGSEEDSVWQSAITGETTTLLLPTKFTVVSGDTIKMQAYQSSGGALDIDVAKLVVFRFAPAS